MISRVASFFVFLGALLGTGTLLSEIQPFAGVPALEQKFAWFAEHANDYDTLFIGSSRVYHGVKPALFDELTAAAGVPTRSFNFGIDAMAPPEDAYVFERIAALEPKNLRWVFIETNVFRRDAGKGGDRSVRGMHWHDTARTALEYRMLLFPPDRKGHWSKLLFGSDEERQPLALAGLHTRLWLTRTLNAGRGSLLLQSCLVPARRAKLSTVIGRARDGFLPIDDGRPMAAEVRAEYERRYAEHIAQGSHISFLEREAQDSLDDMLTRLRAFGARPILFLPPYLHNIRQYPQPGCAAPVLDYREVEKWPALYHIDHRADFAHVNSAGADLFTRAVAADFVKLARSTAR